MEREWFEAMLPSNAAIGRGNPGLVDDKKPATDKQQRPKSSKRNIVLEKNVAPSHLPNQLERSGLANDGEREIAVARRLTHDAHCMAALDELPRE